MQETFDFEILEPFVFFTLVMSTDTISFILVTLFKASKETTINVPAELGAGVLLYDISIPVSSTEKP